MERTLYVVIMAGGSGTRFWPASRRARPKQFLPIAGPTPMLAATWARVAPLAPPERVLVVAGREHAALVREVLPDLPPENLLLEPVARNTLPCVALAAAEVRRRDPEAVQAVLPADHVVAPEEAFCAALSAAARTATDRALVTLGVRPTHPATGYGYIELGEELERLDGHAVFSVARFVEKPERALAEAFVASGGFLWNSGVFVWTCEAIETALEAHAPRVWSALRDAGPEELPAAYAGLRAVPVDVGVMERADDRRVLPVDFTWSDVGSWDALAQVLEPDAAGNVRSGGAALEALDAGGNVVHGEPGTLVALIGVHDLVVVRVGSATLVCRRDRAEDVKALVERLGRRPPEHL